jgi:Tol biopolymer transport system component
MGGNGGKGGSGGADPEPPVDPGGPIPDCSAPLPEVVVKERRWLAFDAVVGTFPTSVTRYLVELTPDGPENLSPVQGGVTFDFDTGLGDWSADGRYFTFTHTNFGLPVSVEVFEVSENAPPVRVAVPVRPRFAHWSPVGAWYYTVPEPGRREDPMLLAVVDVTTGGEKTIEISEFEGLAWSPDARFIAYAGPEGVTLVDTAGESLTPDRIYGVSSFNPIWSPDGRYLVFASDRHVQVYDMSDGTLETVAPDVRDQQPWEMTWYRNDWLGWSANATWFLDLNERPFAPIRLAGQDNVGLPSPDGKCLAYQGECPEPFHYGTCVRTLPPTPEKNPIVVGNGALLWSGTGDALLLEDRFDPPFLTVVDLVGGSFTRTFVTEGTDAEEIRGLVQWDPAGTSDWLFYVADYPQSYVDSYPRIWHRESRQTSELDVGSASYGSAAWSPDGRYLVLAAKSLEETEEAVYVYEVREGVVVKQWTLIDGDVRLRNWQGHFRWQPDAR